MVFRIMIEMKENKKVRITRLPVKFSTEYYEEVFKTVVERGYVAI